MTIGLIMVVVTTGLVVELLDASLDRPIARVNQECANSQGSCKWRVLVGGPKAEQFLRSFSLVPGLLVYPLAPVASLLAYRRSTKLKTRDKRQIAWLAAAVVPLLVLLRFVWLGVLSAVWF